MVSPNIPELSLDLSLPVAPPVTQKTPSDYSKLYDFIYGLEDELTKIQAFKRELPLSCLLLNDAIVKLKEKAKRHRERQEKEEGKLRTKLEDDQFHKKDWMSSVQLWSPRNKEDDNESTESQACKNNEERGVFSSKTEDSGSNGHVAPRLSLLTPSPSKTTVGPGIIYPGPVNERIKPAYNQTAAAKKQRRCWSPELHRRFVDALEKLGGSQVATPKQIRELMQVDGLTNDEVKSHLQKYRLHVRKLPSSKTNPLATNEMQMNQDQLELGCSKLDVQSSGSPEGPLHLARSGKCNSASMEEDEEKSDG